MKTIMIIITMLLICCINISAQDIEPSQINLQYQGTTFPLRQASMLPKTCKCVEHQPHASAWGLLLEIRGFAHVDIN